jgi:Protein of unknown function (DUF4256)
MTLTAKEREALLQALPTRFEKNMRRHAASPGQRCSPGSTLFAHHNGAQSYYAARGFRGLLRV